MIRDCFAPSGLAMTEKLIMQNVVVEKIAKDCQRKIQQRNFAWADNPDVQTLLDAISSIIADEYIEIAKRNLDVFSSGSGTTPNTNPHHTSPFKGGELIGFDESNPYRRNQSGV